MGVVCKKLMIIIITIMLVIKIFIDRKILSVGTILSAYTHEYFSYYYHYVVVSVSACYRQKQIITIIIIVTVIMSRT